MTAVAARCGGCGGVMVKAIAHLRHIAQDHRRDVRENLTLIRATDWTDNGRSWQFVERDPRSVGQNRPRTDPAKRSVFPPDGSSLFAGHQLAGEAAEARRTALDDDEGR